MDNKQEWWKEAVVYQIYPRSFKDSDGDGIGDLKGILSRLDYVESLGVDVIWLNPIYASPNDDNGYDISNYYDIMKEFGNMDDFNRLLDEIHKRGMKLVLDLVVNHTSDEHPWFAEARTSRSNPYYSYYHWWPAEKETPPERPGYFNKSAWEYNRATDSYYLHYFSPRQPDLNWENPEVRKQIFDMMKFWFDKGIDGFRMDSIPLISKDPSFPEIDKKKYPDIYTYYSHGPHLHEYLHEMNREVLSKYPVMTVGEGSNTSASDVALFIEPGREELDMLYGFGPAEIRNKTVPDSAKSGIAYSLRALKKMFTDWDKGAGGGWPAIYLGNHDQPRMLSRFGSDMPGLRNISAKMLITFLLTMRGTPYWFAGDELGMQNIRFDTIDDYRDVDTISHYRQLEKEGEDTLAYLEEQKQIGRDNARTPFQWDETANAGFTTGTPWIRVNPDYKEINAAAEEKNQDSVLNYFKEAVAFRKANKALVLGTYELLDADNEQVYTYLREGKDPGGKIRKYVIALNFSPQEARTKTGVNLANARVVLHNYAGKTPEVKEDMLLLKPYEAAVFCIESDSGNTPKPQG